MSHFFLADFFIAIMPDYLAYHRELVFVSGLFELLGAIGILAPATRVLAGYGLILLSVAVFPANINMAMYPERFADIPEIALYIRLPLQLLIIGFIWYAIRSERVADR